MNDNEPIIINKAGDGYLIKPLSYMFNDAGEDEFKVFSNITELSTWLIEHFETSSDVQRTISKPISDDCIPVGVITEKKEIRTHTGVVGGDKHDARTKPRSSSTPKK